MKKKVINFGIIGCGLMGREFASVVSRWFHLKDLLFQPKIIAVCDTNKEATKWFTDNIPDIQLATDNYIELLEKDNIDAIYCAVPHHLHEKIYVDIINAKKHLLGEKPFGIDQKANHAIMEVIKQNPDILVRCSSEFPFFPGAYQIWKWMNEERFGKIIEVEAGFWHSSDLNPEKTINWKRIRSTNGEYGCMGDLGIHVLHLPLRLNWNPMSVRAFLSNIIPKRKNHRGEIVQCDTWDNAILACDVKTRDQEFPMILSMKRIAPGHANTWFIRIIGTEFSVEFSTKTPKQLKYMKYHAGEYQSWQVMDVPYQSAYPTITGDIFEFGFSDSLLQMWAAFCDELVNRENMIQKLYCVTPEEAKKSHELFTAALESNRSSQTISLNPKEGGYFVKQKSDSSGTYLSRYNSNIYT
jgi:predicted dehydrogenase